MELGGSRGVTGPDRFLLRSANFRKKNIEISKIHPILMHCVSSFLLISPSIGEKLSYFSYT